MTLKPFVHSQWDIPEGQKQVETTPAVAFSNHAVDEIVTIGIWRLLSVYRGTNQRSICWCL